MASVPNTRIAASPAATGKTPAAVAGDPVGFARQLAGIPEELLQAAAAMLPGAGGDAPAPDKAGDEDNGSTTADATDPANPATDAARLAAIAPILQSLPAIAVAPAPVQAPAPEVQLKVAADPAKSPAPCALPPAPAPAPAGKAVKVQPNVADTDADTETGAADQQAAPLANAAENQAIAAAKRTIDAAARLGRTEAADAAPRIASPVARLAASVLETVREAGIAAPAIDSSTSGTDASTAFAGQLAPGSTATTAVSPREAVQGAPTPDRTLDLANDAEWLDRLARDIAQASGNDGAIRFRLHPQTLGHLHVELSQGEHGTSIRLTADTEQARAILADAQPRLAAEARAQGVRIAETHVDLSGSDRQASGDARRQDDARQTPLIRTARDAAADADAPERPGRSRSDRYA